MIDFENKLLLEYIFELFEWTLSDRAIENLKNGEKVGDIE